MDLVAIIAVASAITVIITAVVSVWEFTKRIKNSIKDITTDVVKEALASNNETQGKEFDLKLSHQSELISRDIESVNVKLESFIEEQREDNKKKDAKDILTAHALIESYKRDIRGVHKKLKETGYITEPDKAYVDKIYPLYKDLGGNSDIAQKVSEINEVYMTVMRENYEKRRNNRKKKKDLELEENNIDDSIDIEKEGDN